MLDPLLGLTQHQQTLLKRLLVRIWPRLVQKQVRQHGVRWLRLSLQLHRHQNVSLLLLRKWLTSKLDRNMEALGAVLEETLAMVPTQLGADKSPAGELEFADGDIGGLPIWASSMGKRSHSLPEPLVTCWGWTWIVVLSLATLHSTLFFATSCNGAVLCPLQVSVVGVLDPLAFSEMKVGATQSDFDELCKTLFLNGIIEVADDEPVTDRLNHAVTIGVVPAVAVCPLSQKVCVVTLWSLMLGQSMIYSYRSPSKWILLPILPGGLLLNMMAT